jgi:DNA-directed RNA polymerase specialized sigma24 family protein
MPTCCKLMQSAFTEVFRRHVTLVYRAALHQLEGDSHQAEDVTQVVFTTLALKAKFLSSHKVLAARLYSTTHYVVANSRRAS